MTVFHFNIFINILCIYLSPRYNFIANINSKNMNYYLSYKYIYIFFVNEQAL